MRMLDLIEKKRDGYKLSKEEIDFIINGYTNGLIPDYQMSAWAMAVYFKGMDDEESANLALAMLKSGDEIDLSKIEGIKVDKHSTGGVGDKTTLVLAPMVSSLGIKFAKMSGRGLGHTGGTLDKLESINGFNINLTNQEFINQVNNIGLAVIGQTGNLTPADKKLYALRDVTGTVPSIPLIASSIMSKKLASGADAICLDVKVGSGAFMKDIDSARKLARLMVNIGNSLGRNMTAILTDMDQPLGLAIGNSLEVIEAINTLKGMGPNDLYELCLTIGSYLVCDAKKANSLEEARILLDNNVKNGKALEKLIEMVESQGGNKEYILNTDLFPKAKEIYEIKADKDGYISHMDALKIGICAMQLGAGRKTKEDEIDPSVGVVLNKKLGDKVLKGDVLAYLHQNMKIDSAIKLIKEAYTITNEPSNEKLILDIIR